MFVLKFIAIFKPTKTQSSLIYRFFILFLILFLSYSTGYAQEYKNFSTKNGLPSNHIYDIAQDGEGFMWFATNRGLAKFDGEKFRVFTIKDGLPNNDIWLIETDAKGRIWFVSKSKHQGYIENNTVHSFVTEDSTLISPTHISHRNNELLLNNYSVVNGILKKNDDLEDYIDEQANLVRPDSITYLGANFNNTTIFIYKNNAINIYNKDQLINKIEIEGMSSSKITRNYSTHYSYVKKDLYIFPLKKGIILYNSKKQKAKYYSFLDLIDINEAGVIFWHTQGEYLEASINNHILVFNDNMDVVTKKTISQLSKNEILFLDKFDNIWYTSSNSGVTLISNIQYQSEYYFKNKETKKIEYYNNKFYVGIAGDGFYCRDDNKENSSFKKKNISFFETENISKIRYDNLTNSVLLLSTLKTYSEKAGSLKKFNFTIGSDTLRAYKDMQYFQNKYYIVDHNSFIFQNDAEEFEQIILYGLFFISPYKNKIYTGGMDGIYLFEKEKLNRIKNINIDYPISFMSSNDDYLLIGTGGRGLFVYDTEKLIHITSTEGMNIQKIIQKNEVLWISTENGVRKIKLNYNDLKNSIITNSYYEADGLLQKNTNDILLDDSLLYISSDIGLARINTQSKCFNNKPIFYFQHRDLILEYQFNKSKNRTFSFSILDYNNQQHFISEYRILPNKEWQHSDYRKINLGVLDPGNYEIEVRVTDQHNNQTIKTKTIIINPIWRQTIAAKICFFLTGSFLVYLILRVYRNYIRKKEQEKAQQYKKFADLELKALRSQMNPHFVHNSLNAIQYYIQRNEVELSENYLSKFSRLIRLFFEYSRQQNITLDKEIELLTKYLTIEKLRFEEKLSFEIHVDEKIDTSEFLIPSMILQPIVENAVNHGLFHKNESGTVAINFIYLSESSFEVNITDDGIGINKAKEIHKNSSKNYQSNSSMVLEERLDLLEQSKNWKIKYAIFDLNDLDKSKTGTLVKLEFNQPTKK